MRMTKTWRTRTKSSQGTGETPRSAVLHLPGAVEQQWWSATGAGGPINPDHTDEDQDTNDFPGGVDEDELEEDEVDTDRITSPEAIAAAARPIHGVVGEQLPVR